MTQTHILGISAFYHDSAACLLRDGEIVAAAQEERFTRVKHDHGFPSNAVRYCLRELWQFMRANKKYWLAPIVIVLLLVGILLLVAKGSAIAPFIYTLF